MKRKEKNPISFEHFFGANLKLSGSRNICRLDRGDGNGSLNKYFSWAVLQD